VIDDIDVKRLQTFLLLMFFLGLAGDQLSTRRCFSVDLRPRTRFNENFPRSRDYYTTPTEQSPVISPETFNRWLILDVVLLSSFLLSRFIISNYSTKYRSVNFGGFVYLFIIMTFSTLKIYYTINNVIYLV
jgi:hypothetical protein